MESSAEFRQIMAIARQCSKTNAEFDYSLGTGEVVDADGSYSGAIVHVSNAVHEVANRGLDGNDQERTARRDALYQRIKPELDALIAECRDKKYVGWSSASRGPIRYA